MNFNTITTAMSKTWLPPKLLLIMKLTAVLCFLTLMQVSAAGYSQINLKEKNAPLERVLQSIKKQTGYVFFYDNNDVRQTRISIDVQNAAIESVLKEFSRVLPLTFKIVGNNVLMKRSDLTLSTTEIYRAMAVKGKVLDETGQKLPGVSITITADNFKQSTQTNQDGEYAFSIPKSGKYTLIATFIGYEKHVATIELKKDDVISNITLNPTNQGLDEVMVVAYGNQNRSTFTGSATVLKADVINNSPRVSVQETLQGNVPGVIATSGSGQPGSVPNVRIRGIGSINAGSSPLYVVDGIPLESTSVSSLNSNDIESLTVLKDASAASLYGSRAANGVILITTKKGVAGKTVFNASTQFGFNRVTLSKDALPLNTTEILELIREGWINAGKDPNLFAAEMEKNAVDPNVNTNWFKELTRNGNYSQHNLSASGGNDKTKFFVSGSHYIAKAALLGSDFTRSTGNLRLSNQATDKLSFNLSLKLSSRSSNSQSNDGSSANPVRMYKRYQPWLKIYNEDGTYDLSYANKYNPIAVVKENWKRSSDYGMLGGFFAKYEFTPFLSLENQSSLDFNYRDVSNFNKGGIGTARSNGGEGDYNTARSSNLVNTSILRFNKTLGDHGFGAFIGYETQDVHAQGNNVSKENFLNDTYTLDNASILKGGGSNETDHTLNSVFLNGSYNYKSRYYLSGSVRRDGSSRFGSEKRYGNFWSLGASWNITNEEFMQKQTLFSELRFRTSYGVNGNEDIGNFQSRALYNSASYDQSPGVIFANYGNKMLSWEKNKPFNVGVDFGVLNERLKGTVEYYTRTTSDLLMLQPISATNGRRSYMDNVGAMRNSGFELDLNSINIKSKDNGFTWNTSLNFSTIKNKVLKLNRAIEGETQSQSVGRDYYHFTLRAYAGADPKTGESLWYTDETKTTTTNEYNKAGRAEYGSALPKFFGGVTNTFGYKGVSFSFHIFYNIGNNVYDNWGSNANSDGSKGFSPTDNMPRYVYNNRWRKEGDITDIPKMMYNGTQSGSSNHNSSRFLYHGDYIRLRDVTLGYDLPSKWVKAATLSKVQFYVRANNLYTWVRDKRLNFDPEVGIEGDTDQNAPIYKTVLVGLDIKF